MFSSLATHVSTKQNRCSCIYTLYSIQCFQCLHDLARLKIALNILAHVPKSLLDPDLNKTERQSYPPPGSCMANNSQRPASEETVQGEVPPYGVK